VEGKNMIKPHPCRKLWCLLAALSFISASYAQDSHHKVLKKVPVQYPAALKERGIQGDVRLKVTIKPTGDVKLTELLGATRFSLRVRKNQSPNGGLNRAAPKP